jgi:hypothetical protein
LIITLLYITIYTNMATNTEQTSKLTPKQSGMPHIPDAPRKLTNSEPSEISPVEYSLQTPMLTRWLDDLVAQGPVVQDSQPSGQYTDVRRKIIF